jgi:hypothetical protein
MVYSSLIISDGAVKIIVTITAILLQQMGADAHTMVSVLF